MLFDRNAYQVQNKYINCFTLTFNKIKLYQIAFSISRLKSVAEITE